MSEQMMPKSPEAYLEEHKEWMRDALEAVGADREADPLEVFPAPTEPRDKAEGLPLSEKEKDDLRKAAGRFGIGGEVDVIFSANTQILEGGKPWKVESEAIVAEGASTVIFAGSPHRKIGQDEQEYIRDKYGAEQEGDSELDMVRFLAEQQEGFESLEEDETLPFGYDIDNNHELMTKPTGQLVKIGQQNGQSILLLRVDRENYEDAEGNLKYRNQPDSAALMRFISGTLSTSGDETSAVGLVTSTTYASRAVDAVRAGLDSGRNFGVSMYSRQTIADVRGLPVAEPTAINQIPGELHAMHQKDLLLEQALQQR